MGVSLAKGGNVSLTKEAPGLTSVLVGLGWDVRLSHIVPTGNYGYPSLFMNFADEIVPALAEYGAGARWYFLPTERLWLNPELLRVNHAPYSGAFTPYTAGLNGWAPMLQAVLAF